MANHDDLNSLSSAADKLDARIQREKARLEEHGVLDGEDRLNARDAAIEIARLRVLIRDCGRSTAEREATNAADMAALRTELDKLTALVDRNFKAR